MKKILLYLLLILVGGTIGYSLNSVLKSNDTAQQDPEKIYIEKIRKKVIRDTVKIKKYIDGPATVDSVFISDTVYISDTLTVNSTDDSPTDDDSGNEEVIIMEELISQRTIPLKPIQNDSTDVSELLNLKSTSFTKDIIVEFWQSPLNLTGYELSRNRLKLFGFNPNESITLQLNKNEEEILFKTETLNIVLVKTKQFKSLKIR